MRISSIIRGLANAVRNFEDWTAQRWREGLCRLLGHRWRRELGDDLTGSVEWIECRRCGRTPERNRHGRKLLTRNIPFEEVEE